MLAEGEEIDVLDNHHLRVVFLEEGVGEHLVGVHLITAGQHLHGLGDAHRGLQ